MRYIIICAGDGKRWNNYMGVPKHLALINNEPILYRTIRLLKENGVSSNEIYLVSKEYNLEECNTYYPTLTKEFHDADKFLSSKCLWDLHDRTVILYGDVYFTDDAIKSIVNYTNKKWTLFCRPTASQITGKSWGECFAVNFYPRNIDKMTILLYRMVDMFDEGLIDRIGGWELTRLMARRSPKKHMEKSNLYYVIDDFTEDIDYAEDYDNLVKALNGNNNSL